MPYFLVSGTYSCTFRIQCFSYYYTPLAFLDLTLCTVTFDHSTYRCGNYSREETIQGWKLFAEIRYILNKTIYCNMVPVLGWATMIYFQNWHFQKKLKVKSAYFFTLSYRILIGRTIWGPFQMLAFLLIFELKRAYIEDGLLKPNYVLKILSHK